MLMFYGLWNQIKKLRTLSLVIGSFSQCGINQTQRCLWIWKNNKYFNVSTKKKNNTKHCQINYNIIMLCFYDMFKFKLKNFK